MKQLSIRKMMLMIAGLAVLFAVMVGIVRLAESTNRCTGGRTAQCASNMHNVALALLLYSSEHNGSFPSGTWPNPSLPPEGRLSWYAAISPYLDEQKSHDVLEKTEPWDGGMNATAARTRISVLCCPDHVGNRPGSPMPPTSYIGIAGIGRDAALLPKSDPRAGVFGYDRQTTLADIRDGLANTMVIAESGPVYGPWLQGGPATVRGLDPAYQPYIGPGCQFGGLHADDRATVAFADGSVRVVTKTVNPKVFEVLSTIAGGETLSADWNAP